MAFSLLPREDENFEYFSQITEKIQEASDIPVNMLAHRQNDGFKNYQAPTGRRKIR